MTLRRKLAVTTIAASVAMSAFAGIPLSSKGLSEKLGLSGVAYAATYSDFITEANAIYGHLTEAEVGHINALRVQIKAALEADDSAILDQFVAGIDDGEQAEDVKALITAVLTTVVGSDWQSKYEAIRDEYSPVVSELYPDLTVDALASVLLDMEARTATIVADLDLEDILDTAVIKQQLKDAATASITNNTIVKNFAESIDLTSTELAAIFVAMQDSDSVDYLVAAKAFIALNKAYKLAHPPTGGEGGGGGGGGIITPPATVEIPAEAKELEAKFDALKDKLADATDEEKVELIAEAVKEAQAVVEKLSNIAASVTVVDGKATLELDEKKALSAIAGIAAAAAALKGATGEEVVLPKLTIDLGELAEDEVEVGLSNALIEEAIKANLGAVELKIGDLKIELPVGGQFNKAVDLTVNRSEASPEVTGDQTAASDVFNFEVSIGGTSTTTFSQPVLIQLPVHNTSDVDTDLLTLAKIINDKLTYYGGRYSNGQFTEARDSFSSYVVVENKVSFGDTASVDAWAGRAIEVIAAKGAINGRAEGVFDPAASVTRAEFAKMLVHALDLDNQTAKEKFADVNTGDWFAPFVAAASQVGIINGRSTTKFDPHATITRAEMATMVARALKSVHGVSDVEDLDAALAAFSDAESISASLKAGVAFAADHGIVIGDEGKFAPNANSTRAQAAVIIYRAFNFEA